MLYATRGAVGTGPVEGPQAPETGPVPMAPRDGNSV